MTNLSVFNFQYTVVTENTDAMPHVRLVDVCTTSVTEEGEVARVKLV